MKKADPPIVDRNFSLLETIEKHPLYKRTSGRDAKARAQIEESLKEVKSTRRDIMPGQLLLFSYLNPIHKEELEYYDAQPICLYFGVFNTQNGRRVIGFNLHYYPPRFRFRIANKIFEMYRPIYVKYFNSGLSRDLDGFDYSYIVNELHKYNLSFGVREYEPARIGHVQMIPPKEWATAMFTEGHFKKETRQRIMQLWTEDSRAKGQYTKIRSAKNVKKRK